MKHVHLSSSLGSPVSLMVRPRQGKFVFDDQRPSRHVSPHDQPLVSSMNTLERHFPSRSSVSLCLVFKSSLVHTPFATVNAVPTRLLSGNSNPSKNPSTGQYGAKQITNH